MQHAYSCGNVKRKHSKEIVLYIFNSKKRNCELFRELSIPKTTIATIRRGENYSDITGYYSEKRYKGKHYMINEK